MKGLLILFLISQSVWATTLMGEFTQETETKFGKYNSSPFAIFDRDEIGWRLAQADAFTHEDRQIDVVKKYLLEEHALEVTENDASNIAPYVAILTSSATALPLLDYSSSSHDKRFCFVFPPSANSNQQLSHERITGLTSPDVFGELTYDNLKARLDYQVMLKYSLYHEVAHCLDDTFITKAVSATGGSHSIHLGESFADTMALFMLAKEGHFNVGKTRAAHRAIYSRMMGPFFATHPQFGMGDENFMKGGVIYYLSKSLERAQRWVIPMRFASVPSQINRAIKIVEKSALADRVFSAIYYLFRYGEEETMISYEQKVEDWPDMFGEAFTGLKNYLKDTNKVLEKSFSNIPIEKQEGDELLQLDMKSLCNSFINGNKQEFFAQIDDYRANLEKVRDGAERAVELDAIYQSVASQCK